MNKEKISLQEVADLFASKASISKRAAEEFLKVLFLSVEEALLAGELVKIKNFGTFKLQWNEPRKSVNIQTGEEIILAGYYKVNFIPDVLLKDMVNEPYAHLQPVDLDAGLPEIADEEKSEVPLDPFRVFDEQASEIKNLISEIQAIRPVVVKEPVKEDIPPIAKGIEHVEFITEKETVIREQPKAETISVPKPEPKPEPVSKTVSASGFDYAPIAKKNHKQPGKKRNNWFWILAVVIVIILINVGLYLFYPPVNKWTNSTVVTCIHSVSDIRDKVVSWFSVNPKPASYIETVVIPKDSMDSDSLNVEKPVDSLQILFDTPRIYPEFIATVRIKRGSRLTLISKKYYGNKDFWVYIYEANEKHIPNPDDIPKGTLIRVPKIDPRLIDASNPRCIRKARELHDLYVK
ncbi:MAG: HU family DNA-binding protein [Paludibacter sp.]